MKFYNWNSFEWKCKFSFALFPFFEAFLYWRYGLLYFTAIFHLIAVKAPLQFSFVWKERDISKAWNIMISNTSSLVCYRVFIIECPKNKLLFLGLIRLWRPLVCNIFSLTFGHFRLFKLLSFLIKILKLWKKWKNEQKFEIFWKYIDIRLIGRCHEGCLWRSAIIRAKRDIWKVNCKKNIWKLINSQFNST